MCAHLLPKIVMVEFAWSPQEPIGSDILRREKKRRKKMMNFDRDFGDVVHCLLQSTFASRNLKESTFPPKPENECSVFSSLFIDLLQLCRCVLPLFVLHLVFLRSLGKAVFHDCGISWVTYFIFYPGLGLSKRAGYGVGRE